MANIWFSLDLGMSIVFALLSLSLFVLLWVTVGKIVVRWLKNR